MGVAMATGMLDPAQPFDPDSVARLLAAEPSTSTEVSTASRLGSWGLAHLSSTLSLDGKPRMVGRELESVRLLHALDAVARENAAIVVSVSGVAGSGKTRLIQDTLGVAAAAGFAGRVFSVAAQQNDPGFATVTRLLSARFGLDESDPLRARERLLQEVGELFDDHRVEDVCVFLGGLLGLQFDATPLTRALSKQACHLEWARQTLISELLAADCQRAPLCLVVEDLQYIDRDSLGVLLAVLDDLRPGTLLIASGHPEFFSRHDYFAELGGALHEHVELPALQADEVRALLRQLVGPCSRGAEALESFVLDAGLGNPGLTHDLLQQLWESGALHVDTDVDGCSFDPSRLQELASCTRLKVAPSFRLSSLPSLRVALLETAALVGNACWISLWPGLLRARAPELGETSTEELSAALAELEREGYLLRLPDSRIEGETELVFRDAAERERLAQQISPRRRRALHRMVADWLAVHEQALATSSDLAALFARHLASSGFSYRAALAFFQAAAAARRESSNVRACSYVEQGLVALGEQDNPRRIDALLAYAGLLVQVGRAEQAREVLAEMEELALRLNLRAKLAAG